MYILLLLLLIFMPFCTTTQKLKLNAKPLLKKEQRDQNGILLQGGATHFGNTHSRVSFLNVEKQERAPNKFDQKKLLRQCGDIEINPGAGKRVTHGNGRKQTVEQDIEFDPLINTVMPRLSEMAYKLRILAGGLKLTSREVTDTAYGQMKKNNDFV